MKFTEKFATDLADRSNKINQAQNLGMVIPTSTWTFLQQSEAQLIALMNGPKPPTPDEAGNIEFSWCLYFLNGNIPNLPPLIKEVLASLKATLHLMHMPPSNIKQSDWEIWMLKLEHAGVLTGDGTLMSTSKFAQLDIGWAITVLDYFLIQTHIKTIAPLVPPGPAVTINNKTTLKIAIFGDWGTGVYQDGHLLNSPSQLVMQQIKNMAPDMAIHLGDVYYAGSYAELVFPKLGEEYQNLVNCWSYNAPLGNFTMNSNHEMYDGAHGLFGIALNSKYTSLFKLQNGSTIFTIEYGNWIIVGLDSAYASTSFYMDGAINDPTQKKLLQQVGATNKKLMLLTHHNALTEVGTAKNSLWTDVISNLGRQPDYWYWGHIHNGIIYSPTSAGGTVKCRCLGHAAIPIGNASWFANNLAVSFYTNTPLGDTSPNSALRIKNGFAIVEITGDTVTEKLYDQDGALAWSSN